MLARIVNRIIQYAGNRTGPRPNNYRQNPVKRMGALNPPPIVVDERPHQPDQRCACDYRRREAPDHSFTRVTVPVLLPGGKVRVYRVVTFR